MNDIDIDLNKQLLSRKNSRELTGTKNSFRSAANEIIKDPKIREGRLPSQNQMNRRKTVLGIKPEGEGTKPIEPEKHLSKRASIDDIINQQQKEKENEIPQKEVIIPAINEPKKNENNYTFKQDILTKQAIDEIKDNIEMFKMDINRYVNELREEQEKIELGDVKEEIKVLEDTLTKDLKDTKEQNETDYRIIKESFIQFKDEVFQIINKIVKNNELKIEALYNEIKSYEEEVNKRFVQLSDRQEEYINTLKLILETTKDKTTKQLVKQFLVDDEDIYLNNKARFEKEFNERREKEKKKLEEKEKQLLAVRLRAQEKQLEREEAEEGELLELKKEAENREKNLMQRREEELAKKYEELQKRRDEEEYERQMKMEEDLLNYYNSKEREEYQRKLEFMKNQARISRKNKNKEQIKQKKKEEEYEEEKSQQKEKNKKKHQNIEQNQQREKKSSESVSLAEKSSIKSKKKKRTRYKEKSKKAISEIKEASEKSSKKPSKIPSKKEVVEPVEPMPVPEDDIKSEELAAITKNETPPLLSLKQFIELYRPGEHNFKKFVKNACKDSIISILKCQSLSDVLSRKKRNDLSSEGHTASLSETEQERVNKSLNFTILQINQKIEILFDGLNNYISEDHISNEMQDFYKFITGNNNFVPYSFYSLFELSRIHISGGFIKNIDTNQKKMIIGIYLIIKILINYYMMEFNFLRDEDKAKVDEDTRLNLKLISSIIFNQLIDMNKSVCNIVQSISMPTKKRSEQLNISKDIKVLIEKEEPNFLKGDPDTNENTIEYIALKLFQPQDYQKYTEGIKNTEFSVSKVIYDFINKFYTFMENA